MHRVSLIGLCIRFLPALPLLVGCNSPQSSQLDYGDTEDTSDGNSDEDIDAGGDDDIDDTNGDGQDTEEEICDEIDLEFTVVPVNMMILLDVSGSMLLDENDYPAPEPTKWTQAKDAITAMLDGFAYKINFGFDKFPNDSLCGITGAALSDTLPDNGSDIIDLLGGIYPVGATPIYLTMQNYTDFTHAPIFTSADSASYLIVISDGADTCGLTGNAMVDSATPEQLTEITTILLEDMGIKTYVIGFGAGAEPTQLNAIAAAGGTGIYEYIDAADGEELTAELAEIASSMVSCVYEFHLEEDESDVNMDEVNILFDDVPLFYDEDCAVGGELAWTWLDDEKTQFEFCEEACDMLASMDIEDVVITVGCPPDPVITK